ncbi:hypothetical protein G3F10_092 [Escherichia phage vB_EcoM-G3F10]|nr:hypothetical protein CHD94UKE2_093 [Escherichia phage vB_EcoM-CHD94UKE2]QZI81769.1 hypothetical protein G3F7_092 [Escherichia phage vB_EcoM-G3F7]QZI82639.1 hypothetical protein G3F10_092 [Escherichia phage vB_EcoM-G3F10]
MERCVSEEYQRTFNELSILFSKLFSVSVVDIDIVP